MQLYDRSRALAAARSILDQGGWCVLEVCLDIRAQHWEARLLMFEHTPEAVVDVLEQEIEADPDYDLRLTGCHRWELRPDPSMGEHLCYLAATPPPAARTH